MNNKIKVAWFCDDIDRKTKGQATYSKKLIEQFLDNYSDQVEVVLVHREGFCIVDVCQRTRNIIIKTFKTKHFSGILSWAWWFLINKEKFDIFHVPRHNLYPLFFFAKLKGTIKKFVVTLHGAADPDKPTVFRKGGTLWNWHIKFFAKYFIDVLLADSIEGVKQIMWYHKVKRDKVDYFFISCNPEFKVLSEEEKQAGLIRLKERYNFEPPFLLEVGRLDPHKNVHNLVKGFAILKKKYHLPHKLIIIGGYHIPSYNKLVDETIAKYNLKDEVIIAGFIQNKDMPILYNTCDLFVYMCVNDGFSIPTVEALRSGTPIVLSNASVFPEVAGEAAYYVNPRDPEDIARGIKEMLDNPDLRNEYIKKGLERSKIFSWQQAASDLIKIYKRLLKIT